MHLNDGSTINNIQIVVDPADLTKSFLKISLQVPVLQLQVNWLNRTDKARMLKLHAATIELYGKAMLKLILFRKKDIRWNFCGKSPISVSGQILSEQYSG